MSNFAPPDRCRMVPVWEVLEFKWLRRQSPSYGRDRNALRSGIVFGTGVVACVVPNFGLFVALIGSRYGGMPRQGGGGARWC